MVTDMKTFQTEPPYGDKCHHMKAWSENILMAKKKCFHIQMVTGMNLFQMVTYSNGDIFNLKWIVRIISNGDKFKWWHIEYDVNKKNYFKWWDVQMVTYLVWNE